MICEVIIDLQTRNLGRSFDYFVPQELEPLIKLGIRVLVPFNKQKLVGYVIGVKEKSEYQNLKEIIEVLELNPLISQEMLEMAFYLRDEKFIPLNFSLDAMLIGGLKFNYRKSYSKIKEIPRLEYLGNDFKIDKVKKEDLEFLAQELKKGNIICNLETKQRVKDKYEDIYEFQTDYLKKGTKATILSEIIKEKSLSKNEILDLGFSDAVINTLLKNNCIKKYSRKIFRKPRTLDIDIETHEMTPKQEQAVQKVNFNENIEYLLYGVTNSGKTLVYINLIKRVLENNKQALLLVPEIALTPQLYLVFSKYFVDDVVLLHSNLSEGERFDAYNRILNNQAKVVIGARSAIFAPCNNLGIIIIDEYHENSFYQDTMPYYDARDLAKLRASYHKVPLLLGSATPLIADYYDALNNKIQLIKLDETIKGIKSPKRILVDMRTELKNGNFSILSKYLKDEIIKTLKRNEQVILFINRRGYSTSVMCRDCGEIIKCKYCDLPLTYHFNNGKRYLKCHHCNFSMPYISECPNCHSKRIKEVGAGVDKITKIIAEEISCAKILRLDSDSITKKDEYSKIYSLFAEQKYNVLIGTQMLAKGLDFKNVTLVGILNADLGLLYPSYKAAEETFSLLNQVAGRAGRHKEGHVIIQSYNLEHPVIKYLEKGDYEGFYDYEIKKRKLMKNPPFMLIKEIEISSKDRNKALLEARKLVNNLRSIYNVLGPSESIYFKTNGLFKYNITIKYSINDSLDLFKEEIKKISNDIIYKVGDC